MDRLNEHFVYAVHMRNGRYMLPAKPGDSIEMKAESLRAHKWHG